MTRILLFFFWLSVLAPYAIGQTNSGHDPISRSGIGWQPGSGLTRNESMGGSGIAVPSPDHPNFLNPALLAFNKRVNLNLDLRYQYREWEQGASNRFSTGAGSPSFISMLFPIKPKWSMGAGIRPYSVRDYVYQSRQVLGTDSIKTRIRGSGGTTQVFLAGGYELGKYVRLGLEGSYLLGTLEDSIRYGFLPENANFAFLDLRKRRVSQFLYRPGIYVQIPTGPKETYLSLGATADLVSRIRYKDYQYTQVSGAPLTDTLGRGEFRFLGRTRTYSFALGWYKPLYWSLTAEIDWNDREGGIRPEDGFVARNGLSWRLGGEYARGTSRSTRYINIMSFRAGVQQNTLPFTVDGKSLTDRRVTFGASFPIIRKEAKFSRPLINVALAVGERGNPDVFVGRNRYVEVHVSFTLNDFLWFNRYKVD